MAEIPLNQLTETTVDGGGVFDQLMRATRAHLDEEYGRNRIRGTEYSQVYLGAMSTAMQHALQFLLEQQRADKQAELLNAQILTEELQQAVLRAQECNLKAEYDNLVETRQKIAAETGVLTQKKLTEKAQTVGAGVDTDSVIGRQKTLYQRQADGFQRDAEQKAAKVLVDTWNVRRTTDEGTVADAVNKLDDATIGRAIDKLLTGVSA